MRSLRAVRASGSSWVLLALVAAVVTSAVVVGVGASGGAARGGAYLPVVLLGLVVVPLPATELARRRRDEVALVRLRGGYGARLAGAVAGLSLAAVGVGALLGVAVAGALLRLLRADWGVSSLIRADELLAAAGVAAVLAVPAVGSAVAVAREPLAAALRRPAWSGPGSRGDLAALVLGLGFLVTAGLAVYRAADAPGVLVLAGPALCGLAAGQLLVWVRRGLARTAAPSARSVGLLVGLRRALATRQDAPVRAVVACAVVAATAAGAVSATDAWADDTARLAHGGPVRVVMDDASALSTLLLTRRLDPDGRWLLAAAVNDERDEARYRVAWLDLDRYDRVLGDHLASTPGGLAGDVDALRDAPAVQLVAGDAFTIATTAARATATVDYLDDDGVITSAVAQLDPAGGGVVPVTDCASACVVLGASLSAAGTVSALTLGEVDLLASQSWDRLDLAPGDVARPVASAAAEPMLAAGSPETDEVAGIGGTSRPLAVVGERDALPLVLGAGLVGDLPVALAATGGSVPAVRSLVLAREDTPPDLLDDLVAEGGTTVAGWGPAETALDDRALAEERIGRATGLAAVVLGLLALAAAAAGRREDRRRERAALLLVGVPRSTLRRATRVEAVVLAVGVALAAGPGAWLAAVSVGDGADWVVPGAAGLELGSVLAPGVVVAAALAAAVATALSLVRLRAQGRATPVEVLTAPQVRR